jgi:hypothetical protein
VPKWRTALWHAAFHHFTVKIASNVFSYVLDHSCELNQGEKNFVSRIVSTHFTKLFIILYGLVKITSGCHTLESVPEKKIIEIRTIYPPEFNHTQCYNLPSIHKFALRISVYLLQLNMSLNNMVLASVLEEYYHYAYLFRDELEEEVRKMDFAFNKRTQILLATIIKENNRKLLRHLAPYIIMLIIIVFSYRRNEDQRIAMIRMTVLGWKMDLEEAVWARMTLERVL